MNIPKLEIFDAMLRARLLEERLITMFKQNQGFFWIGGPGEEAFNVCLGLQIKKGQGLDFDYFHHHYRSSAAMVAMGMDPIGPIRQMKNTATDPFSGGRNFSSHYSMPEWNIVPGTSPIETQYLTALGTALAQKQNNASGITIVNGGDAGTAEGDFASCLVWSSRPKQELPLLIIVTNNGKGISTAYENQHGEERIADRAKAFGIKSAYINGNDVEESYNGIKEAMDYVRTERKPFLLEAKVSRLHGHSSASGAMRQDEEDPLQLFEQQLIAEGLITAEKVAELTKQYEEELRKVADQVIEEPQPDPASIYDHTFHGQIGRDW